jgi:hypothetical protein
VKPRDPAVVVQQLENAAVYLRSALKARPRGSSVPLGRSYVQRAARTIDQAARLLAATVRTD